jgi:lysophospholipase L1-like esterase
MNIVLFGDSHLARLDKAYLEYLEQGVEHAIVYNCATGGYTSIDGVTRASYIAQLHPDIVVFSFGANDVSPWKVITPKAEFLSNMHSIFAAFEHSRKIIIASPDVSVANTQQTLEYNERIHDYRKDLHSDDVTLIDANQILAGSGEPYHIEDGVHLNHDANVKILDALIETINN